MAEKGTGAGQLLPQPPTETVPSVAVLVCFGITCGLLSGSPYILQFCRYCSSAIAFNTALSLTALYPPTQDPPNAVSLPSPPHCLSFGLSLQNVACGCVDVDDDVPVHVVRVCPFTVVVPEVCPAGHELLPGALIVVLLLLVVVLHAPCAQVVVPVVVLVVDDPSLLFVVELEPLPEAVGRSLPIGAQILDPLKSPGA